jgi:hypothetical protein
MIPLCQIEDEDEEDSPWHSFVQKLMAAGRLNMY